MKKMLESLLKCKIELLIEKRNEYITLNFVNMGVKNVKSERSYKLAEISRLIDDIEAIVFKNEVRL
jgi:hypothetical protein